MTQRRIRLDRLVIALENARAHAKGPPPAIDELAANIEAFGLLQPLVGYDQGAGVFAVVDGGRRLRALQALAKLGTAPGGGRFSFDEIPLREIDQADAYAVSLAANTQRVDLGIVEAAEAWSAMVLAGMDVATIARVFGVTERFVNSRLALASLHDPILEALREGKINLDVAQAFAGAQRPRQEAVWKKLGGGKGAAPPVWQVKRELKENTVRAGDALARFVGEAAYLEAGGVIERELFADAADSRWVNAELAQRLADDKLAAAKAELEKEGFLFVEAAPEFGHGAYVDGNFGKPRKPTDAEKERLAAIKAEIKALNKERDAIDTAAEKADRAYTEEEDARTEAIDERVADLRTEAERIEDGLRTYSDEAKQKSGAIVSIDEDGALRILRGVVPPKERKAQKPGASAKKGKHAAAKPAEREPQAPMTNLTHERLSKIASVQVGRALANNTAVALAALAACLARDVFEEATWDGKPCGEEALTIKAGHGGGRDLVGEHAKFADDKDHEAARKRWSVALGKQAGGWDEKIAAWPQSDVLDLIAFCVGECVRVVETNTAATHDEFDARNRLATLGRLAGAKPATYVIPLDVLQGFSRPALAEAAGELGIDASGAKTKAVLAAMVADRVEQAGWAPPLLYTLTGAPKAPAAGGPAPAAPALADPPKKKRGRSAGVKNGQGARAKAKNAPKTSAAPKKAKAA